MAHLESLMEGRYILSTWHQPFKADCFHVLFFLGLLPLQTVRGRQRVKKQKERQKIYWRHLYTASLSGRTNLLVTLGWRTARFPVTHYCQKVPNTHSLTNFLRKKVFTAQTVQRLNMHNRNPLPSLRLGVMPRSRSLVFPFRLSPHQALTSPRTTQDSSHVNDLSSILSLHYHAFRFSSTPTAYPMSSLALRGEFWAFVLKLVHRLQRPEGLGFWEKPEP